MFKIPGHGPPRALPDEAQPPPASPRAKAGGADSPASGGRPALPGLRASLVDPETQEHKSSSLRQTRVTPSPPVQGASFSRVRSGPSRADSPGQEGLIEGARPAGSEDGLPEGLYLVGWALASHGQLVHIDVNGRRVSAAYAHQDWGLQLAGPDCDAPAVFSTGFCICVGVVLMGPQHVGLAHVSDVNKDLPWQVSQLQRRFKLDTGSRAERTVLVRFETALRAMLASEQAHDRKDFRSSYSTEIAHGRRLLSWARADGAKPANANPSKIEAVVAHLRDLTQATARQCGASVLNLPGDSLLLEADRTISSFPSRPAFDPHEPTPPVSLGGAREQDASEEAGEGQAD